MFLRCSKQWFYRYVEGLKVPPSGALIEGRAYHETLEENFKQKITSKEDLPVDDCLDIFSTAWDSILLEEETIEWEGKKPGSLKDQGTGLVGEYISSTSSIVQPVRVEETAISEVAGVKFVLRFDLEDENKALIDHKTSARRYNQEDVDKDLQASATAFALNRPIIYYNHVAVKKKSPVIQIVRTHRLRSDIDWWAEMAASVVTQMKSGIAPPRPTGWWCSPRFCGFYDLCRGDLARTYHEVP